MTPRQPLAPFSGFPAGKMRQTSIPAPFFTELMPAIDTLPELKLTLYAIWYVEQLEGAFRYVQRKDFFSDGRFMDGLDPSPEKAAALLDDALERAVLRGTLLRVRLSYEQVFEDYYFLNTARGRAAAAALEKREWKPATPRPPVALELERPNIFRLYEEHIGPLTPMIAEALRDAEQTYPLEWIEDAVRIAVENNVRRWRYVEAILRSWQEEGRDDPNQRGTAQNRRRYIEDRFSEFFKH